jgi:hypothetical protein
MVQPQPAEGPHVGHCSLVWTVDERFSAGPLTMRHYHNALMCFQVCDPAFLPSEQQPDWRTSSWAVTACRDKR